jgi:hypothetical protein
MRRGPIESVTSRPFPARRWSVRLALLWLGCAPASSPLPPSVRAPANPPSTSSAPAEPPALERSAIPRFFEIGTDVLVPSGAGRADTTAWLRRLLEHATGLDARGLEQTSPRLFTYAEPDPVTRQVKRYALSLPPARPFSANDRVVAYWSEPALAFDFGVDGTRSFGSLSEPGPVPIVHRLKALFEPVGANAQAYELIYDVEGSDLRLFEHKGLIPGLPVSFERFTLYRPGDTEPTTEPSPLPAGQRPITLRLGLLPPGVASWANARAIELGTWRVLIATSLDGSEYFLAASDRLRPSWYFGNVAADLVVDAPALGSDALELEANQVAAVALHFTNATHGTVLTGKLDVASALLGYLDGAAAFLVEHDAALADLKRNGVRARRFLRHYVRTVLASHRSRRDPRALTELPFGDAFHVENGRASSASIRYGSDQASMLLGLVHYARQSKESEPLVPIASLTEASLEALTESGAVYESRFDSMSIGIEQDERTGKNDAFIDNGAVGVSFNHLRLVPSAGQRREPGATWGALRMQVDDRIESVDDGRYLFSIDASSLPESAKSDRQELAVSRLFTRTDARLRLRETASVARGVSALRVAHEVENIGALPLRIGDVRVAVGDFFHYGDGSLELSQNRYGLSPVIDGVPAHVGVWLEGSAEPLWGDAFPAGWVDISEAYHRFAARSLVVYGYDRAQLYYIPEAADEVWLYNAGGARALGVDGATEASSAQLEDGDRDWTTLELRYRVGRSLAPGATHASPPVYTYTLRAPLYSADDDGVPDAIQELGPRWAESIEATRAGLGGQTARSHLSMTPDPASIALHVAWASAADLLRERTPLRADAAMKRRLGALAERARAAALRGAEYDLTLLTHLRNRTDLMPSYGTGRNYGFHVLLFDWAHRETGDPRYLDAMTYTADSIASGEARGGLQVTDPSKPNYGAFVQNERLRARGSNQLDDQGIKLWALRVAYDRTRDARYRRSAELAIDHFIQIRESDHLFYGTTKLLDRYVATGPAQQRTPLGHQALMVGLGAWSRHSSRARELYARGLLNATTCHPVHALGTTGPLAGVFPDERAIHFDTDAELAGMFLLALTLDREEAGR